MTPQDKKRLDGIRREVANATPGLLSDFEFLLTQLDAFPKVHGVITCEEAERGINLLVSKLDEAREALRSIRDNYDCDSDAHKYNTECRCCLALKILGEK